MESETAKIYRDRNIQFSLHVAYSSVLHFHLAPTFLPSVDSAYWLRKTFCHILSCFWIALLAQTEMTSFLFKSALFWKLFIQTCFFYVLAIFVVFKVCFSLNLNLNHSSRCRQITPKSFLISIFPIFLHLLVQMQSGCGLHVSINTIFSLHISAESLSSLRDWSVGGGRKPDNMCAFEISYKPVLWQWKRIS